MQKKVSKIRYMVYLFYLFYLIYTPEFFLAVNIPIRSHYIILIINILICYNLLLKKALMKKICINWNKNLSILYVMVSLSAVYLLFMSLLTHSEIRLFQNVYFLFQLFPIIILFSKLDALDFTRDMKLKFLYRITLIQSLSVLIMFLLPASKKIALKLYYLGRQENIFISEMRIFGISSDYTFHTPIFHGLMIGIIFYLYFIENKKSFLWYFPGLVLATVLNGRTGILIAAVIFLIVFFHYLFISGKNVLRIFIFTLLSGIVLWILMEILEKYYLATYVWIMTSFQDILAFSFGREKQGTVAALFNMFIIPSGFGLIFGEGFRLYENTKGLIHSDVGFSNDLFLGGLLYCTVMYSTIFLYVKLKIGNILKKSEHFLIFIIFSVTFLLSNFKGEILRGGPVLIGIVLLKYLLDSKDTSS